MITVRMVVQKSRIHPEKYRIVVRAKHCIEVLEVVDEGKEKLTIPLHYFAHSRFRQMYKALMRENCTSMAVNHVASLAAACVMAALIDAFANPSEESDAVKERLKIDMYHIWETNFKNPLVEQARYEEWKRNQ